MNKQKAHPLLETKGHATEFEIPQEEYSDDEMIRIIAHALKPANRNRPCLCGSGKKYKKCCRGEHQVKFNQFKKEHNL